MSTTRLTTRTLLLGLLANLAVFSLAHGAGSHEGGHGDEHGKPQGHAAEGHAHSSWATPPERFRELEFDDWSDPVAARRGKAIYQQQCASCHGQQGLGKGPVADSLAHKPANLTNHFHERSGKGDGYLFWRVTKGGQVPPFKGANSAMPAFEQTLSRSERWEVLAYVHQAFHDGFDQAEAGQHLSARSSHHDDNPESHGH